VSPLDSTSLASVTNHTHSSQLAFFGLFVQCTHEVTYLGIKFGVFPSEFSTWSLALHVKDLAYAGT